MALKIIGGSFGVTGRATIDKSGVLRLIGTKEASYAKSDVSEVNAKQENHRQISWSSLIIGLVFAVGAFYIAGWIAAVVVMAFAVGSAFYTTQDGVVEIQFKDGKSVTLKGGPYRVDKYIKAIN